MLTLLGDLKKSSLLGFSPLSLSRSQLPVYLTAYPFLLPQDNHGW